jgi:ribosomal protein S18 acetylase RimI-like enzyme
MNQEIRRLTGNDAPAYRSMRLRALAEHPEAFTSSFDEEAMKGDDWYERRLQAPAQTFWGLFQAGELRGMVGLERETKAKSRHKAKVVGMYIAQEYAGQGLGRQLVDRLIGEARAEGLELLVLTVTHGNSQASNLYERCGFRSFGVEPRAIKVDGRDFGKNHMYLDLTARP